MNTTKEKLVDLKPKAEKVTPEQLEQLQDVIKRNNAVQFKIGALETQKHELVHQHYELQNQIIKFRDDLNEQYGTFDVNLDDGTINYNTDESNEANS
jgi:hypothetical protein